MSGCFLGRRTKHRLAGQAGKGSQRTRAVLPGRTTSCSRLFGSFLSTRTTSSGKPLLISPFSDLEHAALCQVSNCHLPNKTVTSLCPSAG